MATDKWMTQTLDLVERAQTGDDQALEVLLRRYYPRVLKIIRLRMKPMLRRSLESCDILQETFKTAVRQLDRFEMRHEGALIHWLAKIAQNELLGAQDLSLAQKRDVRREVKPTAAADASEASFLEPSTPEDPPLAGLVRAEEEAILDRCLHSLPDDYRELIALRNYAGLSFAEIASETGRPSEDAARMMHSRALIELARCVRSHHREIP